jgi:hypothetical protein
MSGADTLAPMIRTSPAHETPAPKENVPPEKSSSPLSDVYHDPDPGWPATLPPLRSSIPDDTDTEPWLSVANCTLSRSV